MSKRDVSKVLAAFREGDRLATARLISAVENESPQTARIMSEILPMTGGGYRVGITGPPGAGKSTLLEQVVLGCRERGDEVGVVAVDPSSPFTGGALLGDRIRMPRVAMDPGVFIRSLGTRGSLGGLSAQTESVVDILDAAGKTMLFLETVGVGQSELDIIENSYTTVVILVPESGDGIQAMKAGLMEIGDIFVVNKADRDGADALLRELETSFASRHWPDGWVPPVMAACALKGEGTAEVLTAIDEHRSFLTREGHLSLRRREVMMRRLGAAVDAKLREACWSDGQRERILEMELENLMSGRLSFHELVSKVMPPEVLNSLRKERDA